MARKVSLIVHNPLIRSEGGQRLNEVLRWNDPGRLTAEFVEELRQCSHATADFKIVERLDIDEFPVKADGFRYTEEHFLSAWRSRRGFHEPDLVDYPRLLSQFDILAKIATGTIDEVWLFAFPYAGYYESLMAGPGAFWCNSPPLQGSSASGRRFIVMGFNYERGIGEMLESFGHRAESILRAVFSHRRGQDNLWERFTRYDHSHPGQAEVGTIHFAPNSVRDYDWGNRRSVPSRCDDWLHYPDLRGRTRVVTCDTWGGGDIRLHHRWWFQHLPHTQGQLDGISNNWWEYVMDPNLVEV